MRLIRGHDYYDSAAGYAGYEKDDPVVLIRQHKIYSSSFRIETIPKDFPFKFPVVNLSYNGTLCYFIGEGIPRYTHTNITGMYPIVVLFAGKLYMGLVNMPADLKENVTKTYSGDNFKSIWSIHDLEKFIQQEKEYKAHHYYNSSSNLIQVKDFDKFEEYFIPREINDKERNWLITNNTAIFMYYTTSNTLELITNPVNIKACGFYKVLSPFQAYQELSMWVGGVLCGRENPMVTISNDDKIAKHGFDTKSFRKEPWKKARKK